MIKITNKHMDTLESLTEHAVATMEDVTRKSVVCTSFVAALPAEVREKNITKSVNALANTMPLLYLDYLRAIAETGELTREQDKHLSILINTCEAMQDISVPREKAELVSDDGRHLNAIDELLTWVMWIARVLIKVDSEYMESRTTEMTSDSAAKKARLQFRIIDGGIGEQDHA